MSTLASVIEEHGLDATFQSAIAYEDERYAESVHDWFEEQVFTQDEASSEILRFPDKAYTRDLLTILEEEQMICVAKTRRMIVTWTVAGFVTHQARYNPATACFWQSDTEDKSAFVIGRRCAFIEDNLPPYYRRPYVGHRTAKGEMGRLAYGTDGTKGYVWGVAQGDAVLRTYTPTILVMDEVEFQQEGHAALTAALPFVEQGKKTKLILISTPNGPSGPIAEIAKSVGFTSFGQSR